VVEVNQPAPISLRDLVEARSRGTAEPQQLIEECLKRAEAWEPQLHAWVTAPSAVDVPAKGQGGALPLSGIPVGIKDLIDVRGLPTRCGSPLSPATPASEDATCVATLRSLGAAILGKTVTTEFGYFAPGPTTNPWNFQHTPGGSSSGSAALVGAGVLPLALGTQTAGSLTRPASYCGAAGFVTAPGSMDLSGVTGLSPTLDSLGMLAAGVDDLYLAWELLTTGTVPERLEADGVPADLVVHYWDGAPVEDVTAETRDLTAEVVTKLGAAGTTVTELDEPQIIGQLLEDHLVVMSYEAPRERVVEKQQLDRLSPQLAELLVLGERISDGQYRQAVDRVGAARTRLNAQVPPTHVVMGPAAPSGAPRGLSATGSPVLSRPWQALGWPVVTVPGLKDNAGMPLGVQVIGRPGHENLLFRAARWVERTILS
jgi:Asp-tRNA(Asn)/Glu-tRNA(Gln) amidotransferase A subunit family amidase